MLFDFFLLQLLTVKRVSKGALSLIILVEANLEASNNSCAPLLVLQKTKRVGTTFLQLASMLSNKNSEPSTIMRWDGYFFDKEP